MLLNFAEVPALKYFYIIEVLVFFYLAFTKRFQDLIFTTFTFILIEGQGRILGNYNLLSKNLFDLFLIIIFVKSFIRSRNFFSYKRVPLFFYFLIVGHFLWYFIQIFNFQSVGPIGVLLASKIYIFPILFFFTFMNEEVDFKAMNNDKFLLKVLILLGVQAYLVFHQKTFGEVHLLEIHPYYSKPIGKQFTGHLFRPFGTSHLPGGISVYISYVICLLFFFPSRKTITSLLKIAVVFSLIFACFIMQVRTGLIQLGLVAFFSALYLSLRSRMKFLYFPLVLSSLLLIPLAFDNVKEIDTAFPDLNLEQSILRFELLKDNNKLYEQRASSDKFFKTLSEKLTKTPFGLGPGRTGAANVLFVGKIKNDLAYDLDYSWTLDNLFISLAIDFGYGMIFYALLVILMPLYLIGSVIYRYIRFREVIPILGTSAFATFVMLLSSWGAIAIPYNPISFFYWFFLSCGLLALRNAKLEV
jgi:hypothetical protein